MYFLNQQDTVKSNVTVFVIRFETVSHTFEIAFLSGVKRAVVVPIYSAFTLAILIYGIFVSIILLTE